MLITGGTGSFGRAFAKHVLENGLVERLCIYSRGEHAQAQMLEELGDDERLRFFIGDVRDKERLRRAMQGCEVVIHAAALKRIEVGAYNPTEMVKTNVLGAMNVVEAAYDSGVKKVVALSSDKAWQPISPYGQSKALAETIFLASNETYGARGPAFSVTRYGNVAGSNGSVIPKWRRQTKVKLTDPDCTRFWMWMEEAVWLVLNTLKTMPRQVVVPEGLPAYRLGDLAEAMGRPYEVVGLPEWEKKNEGMREDLTSDKAKRLTVNELKEYVARV